MDASYGQALLIKHLLIIPLLVFAMINSLLIKKKLIRDIHFNPKPWTERKVLSLGLFFQPQQHWGNNRRHKIHLLQVQEFLNYL